MNEIISVITVCKNSKNEIERTIESVLNQTYQKLEYIVKDGQSTDGTWEIIQSYKEAFRNKKIKYTIISNKDTSLYVAMNFGVSLSNGKWINFMNAGDTFFCNNTLFNIFNEKYYKYDILYGDNMVIDEFGLALNKADISKITLTMPFNHQSCFVTKECCLRFPFNEKFRIGADYDMLLNLYEANKKFIYINQIVAVYSLDGISSSKYIETAKERIAVRREHKQKFNIWVIYMVPEAYVKTFLSKYCNKKIRCKLNFIYKKYFKRYKICKEE